MSRMIPGRPDHSEEEALRSTGDGKLVITDCRGQKMACLLKKNRLLQVSVLSDSPCAIGSIFLGKVKKVVKNIDSCFVEVAGDCLVYLPLEDGSLAFPVNRKPDGRILEGDELPVQIQREALKTKQAAATTRLSLAGRYVVLTAGSPKAGISAKVGEGDRKRLLRLLREQHLTAEDGCLIQGSGIPSYGLILRTEASQAPEAAVLEEFYRLREQFLQIYERAKHQVRFSRLLEAPAPWETALAQTAGEYTEAVTDQPQLFAHMEGYFQEREIPFRLYQDPEYSLSRLYNLETKLEDALTRRIWLNSGAYLVIDITEALTVIDVNSGKYDAKKAPGEVIYRINLEAAEEIARQMRLRNLSGIILVDFISMDSPGYQGELLREMRKLTARDRVLTKVVDITPLGLMEITRKKGSKTLAEQLKK